MMQIEKETSNKIKIILRAIDLEEMNVSVESLQNSSPKLHDFLREIMERVRKETGFNPYNGQIMVEAFPIGEGIMLTVTRVSAIKKTLNTDTAKIRKVRAVAKDTAEKNIAFSFASFDDFCKAMTMLDRKTLKNCEYFKLKKTDILLVGSLPYADRCVLKEYSKSSKKSSVIGSYLKEHAKFIASGDELISMANGISNL